MKRSAFWAGNPCVGLFVSCLVGLQMMRMPPNQALHLTAAASSVVGIQRLPVPRQVSPVVGDMNNTRFS